MNPKHFKSLIMVADSNPHARRLITEVLRGAGYERIFGASCGLELRKMADETPPKLVITGSRIPGMSGLEYARLVRAGHTQVGRTIGIIVMTDTPTAQFLAAASTSGVDEMLAVPFNAQSILMRVESVLTRPRKFVESHNYSGPCRRRRMLDEYSGPLRRFCDPFDEATGKEPWESEDNRELIRQCVTRLSEMVGGLSPTDRRSLRMIYAAVQETETNATAMRDVMMADAARSLGRYIAAVGASGALDVEVVTTHIEAMTNLGMLASKDHGARKVVVDGLTAIVHKRLGRSELAAAWHG